MNAFRKLSRPEQIVRLFEHRVTEAHRTAIMVPLHLTDEQFDQAIPRARDIGVDRGLYLTPIYHEGMEGWWTARPTHRIAALALRESMRRNLGEADRNARVYREVGPVGPPARNYGYSIESSMAFLEASLSEPLEVSSDSDYVLEAVRGAVAVGRGFVERPLAVAA